MRRFSVIASFLLGLLSFFLFVTSANAQSTPCTLKSMTPTDIEVGVPGRIEIKVETNAPCFQPGRKYVFKIQDGAGSYKDTLYPTVDIPAGDSKVSSAIFPLQYEQAFRDDGIPVDAAGTWEVRICEGSADFGGVVNYRENCSQRPDLITSINFVPEKNLPTLSREDQAVCSLDPGETITLTAKNITKGTTYYWFRDDDGGPIDPTIASRVAENDGTFDFPFSIPDGWTYMNVCIDQEGEHRATPSNCLRIYDANGAEDRSCTEKNQTNGETRPQPPQPPCPSDQIEYSTGGVEEQVFVGCKALNTGLGITLSTNPSDFISDVFGVLLSISGSILLLLIIYSGYQMMTSQGDADKIKAARERITSAVVGFVFLIFSMVILEVIGVDILRIPGFGSGNSTDQQYNSIEEQRANRNISVPTQIPTATKVPKPTSTPRPTVFAFPTRASRPSPTPTSIATPTPPDGLQYCQNDVVIQTVGSNCVCNTLKSTQNPGDEDGITKSFICRTDKS